MAGFYSYLLLLCCTSLSFARKLPSHIKQCKLTDPQLNKCILTAVEDIRLHYVDGIPDLKLPSINPFYLDKISLKTGSFALDLTNVNIFGLAKLQVNDLGIDLDKNIVTVKAFLSQAGFRSNYTLTGNVMAIALHGSGYQESDFFDIQYAMKLTGRKEKRNGMEYLMFDKIENEIDAVDGKFRFDDLFKDNPELTARTNEVLNENSKALLKDIKKIVEDTLGSIVLYLFQRVFETFSLEELFT